MSEEGGSRTWIVGNCLCVAVTLSSVRDIDGDDNNDNDDDDDDECFIKAHKPIDVFDK